MGLLFKHAEQENLDRRDFENIGAMMNSGMSAEAALKNMRLYGIFTVDIVASHEEIGALMRKYYLVNKSHLFKKIMYGELPALNKPDFVSSGVCFKPEPKDVIIDKKKYVEMRQKVTLKGGAGLLTKNQEKALESTENLNPDEWNDGQCEQIESIYNEVFNVNKRKTDNIK